MKIMHLCLSCYFVDDFAHQENMLPKQNKLDGHDVRIIASCETYINNKKIEYVEPSSYLTMDGVPITRLKYMRGLPQFIKKKLRIHSKLIDLLQNFNPDVILFHGLCGWELITVVKYKKKNPKLKFYADSHEDSNNSGRSFLSKTVLHKFYYRAILHYAIPYIDKIFYVTPETKNFIKTIYKIQDEKMEYFPLGGNIYNDETYNKRRIITRKRIGIGENDIMILQAGKMGKRKKIIESMRIFNGHGRSRLKLVIIGSLNDEIYDEFISILKKGDSIFYLGWKSSTELMDYLCAADVYLQPGSQSSIMQNALCLRCAVILDDVFSHKQFVKGNGWILNKEKNLANVLNEIDSDKGRLRELSVRSLEIAKEQLDYKKIASRLYL